MFIITTFTGPDGIAMNFQLAMPVKMELELSAAVSLYCIQFLEIECTIKNRKSKHFVANDGLSIVKYPVELDSKRS
jgi:hypothetical protein